MIPSHLCKCLVHSPFSDYLQLPTLCLRFNFRMNLIATKLQPRGVDRSLCIHTMSFSVQSKRTVHFLLGGSHAPTHSSQSYCVLVLDRPRGRRRRVRSLQR